MIELPPWARPERPVPGRGGFSSIPGEQRMAGELGGQRRAMSGAGQHPYDLSTPQDDVAVSWLIDRKESSAASQRISRSQLEQLTTRALREGRRPLIVVLFFNEHDVAGDEWVLVRRRDIDLGESPP